MKRRAIIVTIVCAIIILGTALFFYFLSVPEHISTSFADSANIEFTDGTQPIDIEIENDDTIELIGIFHGKQIMRDSIGCPFGGVRVNLLSVDDELTLYPAGDDCPTVAIGRQFSGGYILLSEDENSRVREILIKYGITYSFV